MMLVQAFFFPLYLVFSIGILPSKVAALPSIRGLSKSIPKTDQETKPAGSQVNLAESQLKSLSFKQFLDFLIEEVADEQYLEALDLRYDKKYQNAFASVLTSNPEEATASTEAVDRALQDTHTHRDHVRQMRRKLFGQKCNVQEDCESDEVCEELTVRGVTANFCFRATPPVNQVSEPGDCTSGDAGMACPDGATCEPTAIETKDGPKVVNRCRCKEEEGYVTRPGTFTHPDIENIIAGGNLDYYGCVQVDECSGANICPPADEGGVCRDKGSDDGFYDCFCRKPNWIVAETDPVHGATRCKDRDECADLGNSICPANSSCENTIGGYNCNCDEGFLETVDGLCVAPEIVEQSKACDPEFNNGDSCPESNNFCDPKLLRCLCIEGLIQPAGAGGSCIDQNECLLGTDFRCDKPHAKCENLIPTVEEPQGYRCECLAGYTDAPNQVRGTNCIPDVVEIEVTPAPSPAVVEASPAPAAPTSPPRPGPTPPCQTEFANQCSAIEGEAICVDRSANGAPACICDSQQFYFEVDGTSYFAGLGTDNLVCQLNECKENTKICTLLDPNTVCVDAPEGYACPCADGFFLNSTSGFCETIPCRSDTDCTVASDNQTSTQQQRVCRQVLPRPALSAANTENPLLNGCVCNVDSNDWELQELDEVYCVRNTCEIDDTSCPEGSNRICKNAPGSPGYTCVCDLGFGENADGNCIDPCDTHDCNPDQVCQRVETNPPRFTCEDRNPCFENPCSSDQDGPFCVQDTSNVTAYQCYCNVNTDCADDTVCFKGKCKDTCENDPCATDDRGSFCERDTLKENGFSCHCNDDSHCVGRTTQSLTMCTTHLADNICIDPDEPCKGDPCSTDSRGSDCEEVFPANAPPSFSCSCSLDMDCSTAGSNTVCDTAGKTCTNPCDDDPNRCAADSKGSFCAPNFGGPGFLCGCNDNIPTTSNALNCGHLEKKSVCGDADICVCDFGFGEDVGGNCVDPCNPSPCAEVDQVCQRDVSTSPPTATCVDKNQCFPNPCTNDPSGPLCIQDAANAAAFQCGCSVDTDCKTADTVCFQGTCTDTCDGVSCASDAKGAVCTRDGLTQDGFVCGCAADTDCTAAAAAGTACIEGTCIAPMLDSLGGTLANA